MAEEKRDLSGLERAPPAYDARLHDPFFDGLTDQLADKGSWSPPPTT